MGSPFFSLISVKSVTSSPGPRSAGCKSRFSSVRRGVYFATRGVNRQNTKFKADPACRTFRRAPLSSAMLPPCDRTLHLHPICLSPLAVIPTAFRCAALPRRPRLAPPTCQRPPRSRKGTKALKLIETDPRRTAGLQLSQRAGGNAGGGLGGRKLAARRP